MTNSMDKTIYGYGNVFVVLKGRNCFDKAVAML